jgi:hypothetical protein
MVPIRPSLVSSMTDWARVWPAYWPRYPTHRLPPLYCPSWDWDRSFVLLGYVHSGIGTPLYCLDNPFWDWGSSVLLGYAILGLEPPFVLFGLGLGASEQTGLAIRETSPTQECESYDMSYTCAPNARATNLQSRKAVRAETDSHYLSPLL